MRCINLIGTFLNLYLIYKMVVTTHWINQKESPQNSWTLIGFALSLVLLPPLFFWFFLYYTDVVSVNLILLTSLLHLQGRYKLAACTGE